MTFVNYLSIKKNFIIIWLCFHFLALFVNIFEIQGNLIAKSNTKTSYSQAKNFFTTYGITEYSKQDFWPFVTYFGQEMQSNITEDYDKATSSEFYGVFTDYDYSEFIAYQLLLLIFLYFYWNKKYNSTTNKK